MNETQGGAIRFVVIVAMSILFTGALLLYTAQANLDLLTQVSPNPKFVGFGMVALEGGVIYWVGYFMLHWNGTHKGIALVLIFIDFAASMVGFFVETNNVAMSHGLGAPLAAWFPQISLLLGADVMLNVFTGILVHLLPHNAKVKRQDFVPLLDAGRNTATFIGGKAGQVIGAGRQAVEHHKEQQALKNGNPPK